MSRCLTKGGDHVRLKELRVSRNLTQLELANLLKVERTTVTMWENGKFTPKLSMLQKISTVLGCSVDDLIKSDK